MRRIIALLLLSGLAAVLASGEEQPTSSNDNALSPLTVRQADREITQTGDHTRHARIFLGTQFERSQQGDNPVDYALKPLPDKLYTHAVTSGAYMYREIPGNPAAGHRFEHGESYVTFVPEFNTDEMTITVTPRWNGIKEDLILTEKAPSELSWRIETNTLLSLHSRELRCSGPAGGISFIIPAPTACDQAGIPVEVDVILEKDILTYRLAIPESPAWPIILDPSVLISGDRDGRVQRTGQATYTDARDGTNGIVNGTALLIGQNGVSTMSVYRTFVSFPIPELASAAACTLYMNGTLNYSITDFEIYLLGASAYKSTLDGGDFSRFDGREAGMAHTGTILNDTWSTSSFSSGWNTLVFNTAGLDSVAAAAGDTLWLALISGEDYAHSAPTNEEYVAFESSAHTTEKPYLALDYTTDESDPDRFTAVADGRLRTSGHTLYASARDTTAAQADGNWVQTGQQKNLLDTYSVYRSFLSFPLPDIYTGQAGTLFVKGYSDWDVEDGFDIFLVGASAYGPTLADDDFLGFDGNETGSAHTGTILNDTWNSTSFSLGWNTIVFNQAGLDSLRAASGDTLRIAMLSSDDYSNTAPDGDEYIVFRSSITSGEEPYLSIDYTPGLVPPTGFSMTALDDSTIACSWEDIPGETGYAVVNWPDTSIVHFVGANAVADTITGLDPNTIYSWAVLADSSGVKGLSAPDSTATLLAPPVALDIRIMPVSSDSLRIGISDPLNGSAGDTGMEVAAISGAGADSSGWLTGVYRYLDGGLDCDSTYVYRIRLRNRDGVASGWSEEIVFAMNGRDSLIVKLPGDLYDDYAVDGGSGRIDSTLVRAGTSDAGAVIDGYLMFTLPWQVQKGGVDSLFVILTRDADQSARTPALWLTTIPDKLPQPTETIDLGAQDISIAHIPWTVSAGTGKRRSPDLRPLFREWQETEPIRDYPTRFGLRLGGGTNPDSVRAVLLDASHASYDAGSYLTIYYTPGVPDSLDAAPTGFDLAVESPDSITASWVDQSRFELGFLLLNAADSTFAAGTDTLAENSTSIGVGGLIPNTVHQWFIRAFSATGDSSTVSVSVRTLARTPGPTTISAISDSSLVFVIDPADNPAGTEFAVQDSLSGFYIDGTAMQDTLRPGPPGEWAWRSYADWGAAAGDTLTGLAPDSLFVLRANARTTE